MGTSSTAEALIFFSPVAYDFLPLSVARVGILHYYYVCWYLLHGIYFRVCSPARDQRRYNVGQIDRYIGEISCCGHAYGRTFKLKTLFSYNVVKIK